MIDPCIWESEDFSKLSYFARLVWIGLFSIADDEGRGKGNSAYIKSQIFAYDESLSVKDIDDALAEIEKIMSIHFYEVDGKKYYQLQNWLKFQVINRPSPSQIPAENEQSMNTHGTLTEYSLNTHGTLTNNSNHQQKEKVIQKEKEEIEIEVENKENSLTRVKESEVSLSTRPQKHKYGTYKNVLLTETEYQRLIEMPDGKEAIEFFSEYREIKDYKSKNDNLAIRKWVFNALKEQRRKNSFLSSQNDLREKVSKEEEKAWSC